MPRWLAATLALFLLLPQVDLSVSGLFYQPRRRLCVAQLGAGNLHLSCRPVDHLGHRCGSRSGLRLAVSDRAAVVAVRPQVVVIYNLVDGAGSGTPRQHGVEGPLGPGPAICRSKPSAERFISPRRRCRRRNAREIAPSSPVMPRSASRSSRSPFCCRRGKARRRGVAAALGFGAFVGLVRIAQGGHFLSDVVWAGLLVFGTTAILHWWIVERDGLAAPALLRFYRLIGRGSALACRTCRRSWTSPAARIGTAVVADRDPRGDVDRHCRSAGCPLSARKRT